MENNNNINLNKKIINQIGINSSFGKNNNLNLQQNVTKKNEMNSTSDAKYLKIQLENLIKIWIWLKKFRYEEMEKKNWRIRKN